MAKFRANTDDAYILTNIQNQESGDNDWAKYQIITQDKSRLILHNDTTNDLLKVFKDTTQAHDIFGDGSAIATYTLDDNANDLGGNYNGTWSGTEQYDIGVFGQAAKFDGSNQINCGVINTDLDELWISFWMYWNGIDSIMPIGFYKYDLYICYGSFGWNTGNSDSYGINFPASEYANRWLHVVVNFKTDTYGDTMYINGISQNLSQKQGSINSSEAVIKNVNFCISGWSYDNSPRFKGLIDQVRIFNRALTEDEVAFLYHEGLTHIRKHDQLIIYNASDGAKIYEVTSITDNDTDKTYDIDISSLSLTEAPTNAHQLTKSADLTDKLIDSETTTSNVVLKHHLVGPTIIKNKEPIVVYNPTDGFKKKDDIIVTRELVSTVNIHDIFGDNSIIATYSFDGNANDLGGNYNGAWSGTEQYDAGKFGQAAKFDSSLTNALTTSYEFLSRTNNVTDTTEVSGYHTTTFSAWMKITDGTDLVLYNTGGSSNGYGIGIRNLQPYIAIQNNDTFQNHYVDFDIQVDTWYHLCFLFDESDCSTKVYVNGSYIETFAPTTTVGDRSAGIRIGSMDSSLDNSTFYDDSSTHYNNGLIDQVRIFNRALTEDEIKYLFYEQYLKYNIDVSSLNLTTKPTSVYVVKPRIEISVGDEDKANADDLVLDVLDSTTTSITVGYYEGSKRARVKNTEKVDTDTGLDLPLIEVVEEYLDPTKVDPFDDNSAVATYTFDGNANDLGGNYNGTLYGNPTFDTGKFGQAIKLDGTDDYVDTGWIIPAISAYTFSCWIKMPSVPTGIMFLFGAQKNGQNAHGRAILAFKDSKFYASMGDGSNYWYDYSTVDVSELFDNNWHHIVLVVDNTIQTLYIDRNLKHTYTSSVAAGTAGEVSYWIGANRSFSGPSLFYNGLIDQLRIFNRALAEDEVKYLYNEGKYKFDLNLQSEQSSAPTKAIIRPTIQDILELDTNNTAYDNTNDLVNVYYRPIQKGNGFRSVQVKWNAHRQGDENSSLRVNLWKKVA